MRKIAIILVLVLLTTYTAVPIQAYSWDSEGETMVHCSEYTIENEITVIGELVLSPVNARASSREATVKRTFIRNEVTIAEIWVTATFRYDGNTVSVVSKSISKCETYDGWSFKQSSFTSSGGTVSLTGKLTKLLVLNANVSISLTCDENGNIS